MVVVSVVSCECGEAAVGLERLSCDDGDGRDGGIGRG